MVSKLNVGQMMKQILGLMDEGTKDSGTMVNSMEKECTLILKGREKKENGMKERELDGSMKL